MPRRPPPAKATAARFTGMADRSHLAPVTTIDKRGRTTTVYRRPPADGVSLRPGLVPAAAPPAAPVLPPDPADLRPSLSEQQLREFTRGIGKFLYRPVPALSRTYSENAAGRSAAALAVGLTTDGVLTAYEAEKLLVLGVTEGGSDNRGAALARDSLRVAARLAPRWPERDRGWTDALVEAAIGARVGQSKRIADRGELDSLAAVVEFTLRADPVFTEANRRGDGTRHRRIFNRHLDALLRERPHDIDRIIERVTEQGIHPRDEAPVQLLREWLDATVESPALEGGWL